MDPQNFFAELKRRNVYKVAVAYAIVGWLLIQIATQVFSIPRNSETDRAPCHCSVRDRIPGGVDFLPSQPPYQANVIDAATALCKMRNAICVILLSTAGS
jgi:hypothetical protein